MFPKMNKFLFALHWCLSTWFGLIRLYKYSSEWDKTLNRLIDRYWDTAELDDYTIKLGECEVWVANAYYGYGNEYIFSKRERYRRPSIKTMYRLASLHAWLKDQESKNAVVGRLKGEL